MKSTLPWLPICRFTSTYTLRHIRLAMTGQLTFYRPVSVARTVVPCRHSTLGAVSDRLGGGGIGSGSQLEASRCRANITSTVPRHARSPGHRPDPSLSGPTCALAATAAIALVRRRRQVIEASANTDAEGDTDGRLSNRGRRSRQWVRSVKAQWAESVGQRTGLGWSVGRNRRRVTLLKVRWGYRVTTERFFRRRHEQSWMRPRQRDVKAQR